MKVGKKCLFLIMIINRRPRIAFYSGEVDLCLGEFLRRVEGSVWERVEGSVWERVLEKVCLERVWEKVKKFGKRYSSE